MPVYNERHLVEASVERVLALQHPSISGLELIVVDDGSTDGSWEILQRLVRRDARIKLLRHEGNRGKGAAIRTGIAQSAGTYVGRSAPQPARSAPTDSRNESATSFETFSSSNPAGTRHRRNLAANETARTRTASCRARVPTVPRGRSTLRILQPARVRLANRQSPFMIRGGQGFPAAFVFAGAACACAVICSAINSA